MWYPQSLHPAFDRALHSIANVVARYVHRHTTTFAAFLRPLVCESWAGGGLSRPTPRYLVGRVWAAPTGSLHVRRRADAATRLRGSDGPHSKPEPPTLAARWDGVDDY